MQSDHWSRADEIKQEGWGERGRASDVGWCVMQNAPHATTPTRQARVWSVFKQAQGTPFNSVSAKKKKGGGAVVELLPPHPNPLIPSVSSWVEMPTQEQVRITYILVEADS